MAIHPAFATEFALACKVERIYAALIPYARPDASADREPGLGGQLLYAGELNDESRMLIAAANVAGAATLAASEDKATQKQAVRDGVVDFLVTNLDEALRILKNEIRKRETVAVCVGEARDAVESEMRERGVLPDLIAGRLTGVARIAADFVPGAKEIEPAAEGENQTLLAWGVGSAPAQLMPKLDAIAFDCQPADAWTARRWLRLAPRYLGRLAKGVRVLSCESHAAEEFVARVRLGVARGEIGVPVEIQAHRRGLCDLHQFSPDSHSSSSD
jgi:hypothetical protein